MELLTKVDIPHAPREINYQDKLLLIGSCFSDHIAGKLSDAFFQVSANPFGTLYNPLSITRCIRLCQQVIDEGTDAVMPQLPVVFHNGLHHSLLHHGMFSSPSEATLRCMLTESLQQGAKALQEADILILTFGSAWIYEREGSLVSNCHRLPASQFTRRRLCVEEIVNALTDMLSLPCMRTKRLIFTVSPIRHKNDGLHANSLSKSTLLLAIDSFISFLSACARPDKAMPQCHYFPAYEILMDELRDYRFYADDMLHPAPQATEYIWERFCETWFSVATRNEMKTLQQLRKALNHRPLHPDGSEYKTFKQHTEKLLQEAQSRYPWITP